MPRIHPKKIRVLVANASEAKYYETQKLGKRLQLVKKFNHPQSRERDQDLITDRAGRFNTSIKAHVSANTHKTLKTIEADNFARELAEDLNHEVMDELIVITPAHFYGMLNKHWNDKVLSHLVHSIKKDYTKMPQNELEHYLEAL